MTRQPRISRFGRALAVFIGLFMSGVFVGGINVQVGLAVIALSPFLGVIAYFPVVDPVFEGRTETEPTEG